MDSIYSKFPNYDFPDYTDYILAIMIIPVFIVLRELTNKVSYPIAEMILTQKYKDPTDEENYSLGKIYVKKLSANFYKVIFYICNVTFGFYVLKDLNFFPAYFGGSGDFKNIFVNGNMDSTFYKPPLFKIYYMMYLSHNLTDILYLLFIYEKQTDFPLMFLHHTCTISLIFFSHYTNHSHIGAIVMFLHDIADIIVYYMRSVINTDVPEIVKISGGFTLIVVYSYTRLFVFGKLIHTCWENQSDWNIMYSTLLYFLMFLYSIHIYWLFQIIKKVYNAIFNKEISDTQSFNKQLN